MADKYAGRSVSARRWSYSRGDGHDSSFIPRLFPSKSHVSSILTFRELSTKQIDTQLFWSQLQQICLKRGIQVFEEIHQGNFVVDNKPVDLLQLFQTVVSRGGGYGKVRYHLLHCASPVSHRISFLRSTPETLGRTSLPSSRYHLARLQRMLASRRSTIASCPLSKTLGRLR